MGAPLYERWDKLEERLDLRLEALSLLRENATCWIYQAEAAGETVVVKQYKRHARALCAREADALALYGELCESSATLLPSRTLAVSPTKGTLCVSYIDGRLMSEVLRGPLNAGRRKKCQQAVGEIGHLLSRLRKRSLTHRDPSPFLEEYILFVSRGLERTPGLGAIVFRGYERQAARLYEELCESEERASLSHGDLVPANIVVGDRGVGLIDFANTNPEGHTLDDLYNFQITCENLVHLPSSFRRDLVGALHEAVGLGEHDERAHRFFWEYHRRRWILLQLSGGLAHRAKALVRLPSMLRPFSPEHVARSQQAILHPE